MSEPKELAEKLFDLYKYWSTVNIDYNESIDTTHGFIANEDVDNIDAICNQIKTLANDLKDKGSCACFTIKDDSCPVHGE